MPRVTLTGSSAWMGPDASRDGNFEARPIAGHQIVDGELRSGVVVASTQDDGTFALSATPGAYDLFFRPSDVGRVVRIGAVMLTADCTLDTLTYMSLGDDSVDHIAPTLNGASTWIVSKQGLAAEPVLTGNATVSLSVASGVVPPAVVAIHPTLNGHTLTVEGIAITGDATLIRWTSGAWSLVSSGAGGGADPGADPTDTTAPTAGTLAASSVSSWGFTLTVTGASDAVALAALPYRMSTDNGATWSAWRSTPLAVTGKTASTAYQCKHQTKDAAGNIATGAAITVTTSAASIADPTALPSLLTWFDATDLDDAVATGSNINSWSATAGASDWTYTASTGPSAVTLATKRAAKFTTDTQGMSVMVNNFSGAGAQPGAVSAPYTHWAILQMDSLPAGGTVKPVNNGAATLEFAADGAVYAHSCVTASGLITTGSVVLVTFVAEAAAQRVYIGATQRASAGAPPPLLTTPGGTGHMLYLGGSGVRATVCEAGFHTAALSAAQVSALHDYAVSKWGAA